MSEDVEIENGVAYFSGNPYTLLREKPERLVAFFSAAGAQSAVPDKAALAACKTFAPQLTAVDRAALYAEARALLTEPQAAAALSMLRDHKIIQYVFGFPLTDMSIMAALPAESPWQARLVALLLTAPLPPENALKHLVLFWKLSETDAAYLQDLLDLFPAADPAMPKKEKSALEKKYDADFVKSLFLLRHALES